MCTFSHVCTRGTAGGGESDGVVLLLELSEIVGSADD